MGMNASPKATASDLRMYNSHGPLRKVLLCPPDYYHELEISEIAHRTVEDGEGVDLEKAKTMHHELAETFAEAGVAVEWERPHPDHVWQVYTRDFGVNTPAGVLIGKYRYEPRWGDEEFAIEALETLGVTVVGRVGRGAVEGGDCWLLDETTLAIGAGNRSTLEGIQNAAEILKPHGIDVVPVEFLAQWNHLDMIFAVVAEKLALFSPDGVPGTYARFLKDRGWRLLPVPEEQVMHTGCNVFALGEGRVLSFAQNGSVNELLRAEGFTVLAPSLGEFTKMGGGPHCLTFELQRDR
jgi:N-dimethylarginine dimethylaminohydrolase